MATVIGGMLLYSPSTALEGEKKCFILRQLRKVKSDFLHRAVIIEDTGG